VIAAPMSKSSVCRSSQNARVCGALRASGPTRVHRPRGSESAIEEAIAACARVGRALGGRRHETRRGPLQELLESQREKGAQAASRNIPSTLCPPIRDVGAEPWV
jgi:hypothetical protein